MLDYDLTSWFASQVFESGSIADVHFIFDAGVAQTLEYQQQQPTPGCVRLLARSSGWILLCGLQNSSWASWVPPAMGFI